MVHESGKFEEIKDLIMKRLLILSGILLFVYFNLVILARSFIPYDHKLQDYVDRGDDIITTKVVLRRFDSVTSQFRNMGSLVIQLDIVVLCLVFYLVGQCKKWHSEAKNGQRIIEQIQIPNSNSAMQEPPDPSATKS